MGFSRRNKVNIFLKGGVDFQSEEHYLDFKKLDSFRSPLFNEELERELYETQLILDQIVDYINQLPKYKPTEVGIFSNFNRLFPSLRLLSMEDATNPESNFERGVNRVRYYMQKKEYIFISVTKKS